MKANGTIKIEKGIPFVDGRKGRHGRYPWEAMQVGDSFAFPGNVSFAYETARTATKRYPPKVFKVRKVDGVMRCWRVE